jgi:predicted phage terminase large subunit-like protein
MTPRVTPYIPFRPTPKQAAFLLLPHREAFYGGAAGGAKSTALLMAALQYVDVPGYAALLLRRTYADLSLPGALMDKAHTWLQGSDARWRENTKTWEFPSGASITFGYLEGPRDHFRYQSSEFQLIAWDELSQFDERQYLYMFSRLRRLKESTVPLRMRSASNPGGTGHAWVYERFVVPELRRDRIFIPAKLADNPHIDRAEYEQSLSNLDDVTKAQLLEGLWVTDPAGKPFLAEWWQRRNRFALDDYRLRNTVVARWISIDTALKDKETSDYSAFVVGELTPDYRLLIRHVRRDKLQFPDLPATIEFMAHRFNEDGKLRAVIIEDKASGTSAYQTLLRSAPDWLRKLLIAFTPTGDKGQRARQAAVWCKRDCIWLPKPSNEAPWLYDFENEMYNFPDVGHDDQVDALSQLILYTENYIAEGHEMRAGRLQQPEEELEAEYAA